MARKRKNVDVLAQLGEPLPLPYRPTLSMKLEDVEEENDQNHPVPDTFRPHSILLRYKERDTDESRPKLPIWHAPQRPRTASWEETLLDSIESKIAALRAEIGTFANSESERDALEKIELDLDAVLEKKHEDTLMQELKRLQHQNSAGNSHKGTFFVVAILFFLVGSYIAASYSYDYCYYFC